ncbi:peptidase [Candidatus Nitrosopelagicus sp.]|nr:peptidase [Candidatus Nitrosopelagicus sp.]
MNAKFFIIPVFLIGALFLGQIPDSFGHGLGSETMPPVMVGDIEATLEVNSSTIYTDIDGEEKGIRQISINFFETFTNIDSNQVQSIDNVTFQVELIKAGDVLIKETFQRDDGILIMNLTPSNNEQVQVMERETFASFFGLASEQYNFEGEIFENGGLYEFEISVITINSYDNVLTNPVNYELGISIEETTRYEINDVNYGKQELGIVTFFDQITEFDYNAETKEITFSFPFEWNQETIDQTTVIHEEVLVPKTFGDLLVSKYVATLNEVDLPESMINIDDFSSDDRIVHVVVSQKELQEIFSNNEFSENKITMIVKPESDLPLSGVTENGQFKVNLWWTKELRSGEYTIIRYDILDTFLKDKPIAVPYELKIFHNDEKIFSKSNVSSDRKSTESRPSNKNDFEWNIPSNVSGLIILKFENLDGGQVANVEFPLVIDRKESQQISSNKIPEWVKNTAGWWATNQIPDLAFVNGIEFLVKEKIIVVSDIEKDPSTPYEGIPEWLKTNAGWWAEGQIDDKTFATGIEYLIRIGLIIV